MSESILLNNRYQLEAPLGKGGMAEVYRARDLMLERFVAIKILRQDYSSDPQFRDHFRQEAKAVANLSHPNIVTVYDFGLDAERLFIIMEYVPGADLKSLLQRQSRFAIPDAIGLITQACAGIGYAHRAGLVHCDVKPQNMLVTPDRRLKVTDFGIARALTSISPDEHSEVVWGSPLYFSPEQAAGGAPSPASDVYSLGIVLYEILTGQVPFTAASSQELARLHREALPPSPRKYNPDIPVELEQIILKVLSKEPAARYRTADQLGRVLLTFQPQPPLEPLPTAIPPESGGTPPVGTTSPRKPPAGRTPAPPSTYPAGTAYRPARQYPRAPDYPSLPGVQTAQPASEPLDFDWLTWLLALLAFIALGGLIPFLLWVYSVLNPPI